MRGQAFSTARMPVLLTRPVAQSEAVARDLTKDGIDCAIWPLTEIVLTSDTVEIPSATDGLLFTSANGVRAFARLFADRNLPALCVGPATEAAARSAGFADARSADGDAQALAGLARGSGLKALFHSLQRFNVVVHSGNFMPDASMTLEHVHRPRTQPVGIRTRCANCDRVSPVATD